MEYSFEPYRAAPISFIVIWWLICGTVMGGVISFLISMENDFNHRKIRHRTHWSIMGLLVLIATVITVYTRPKYDNIQVVGTKVDQYEQTEMTTGKNKRQYMQGYVVYKVPEGEVSFRRNTGVVYPQQAIIYMNKRRK